MKFTTDQLDFIKKNFESTTSKQLFQCLVKDFEFSHCYTSFRSELYVNGFYKVQMRRWSRAETAFLLSHYQSIGNVEIGKLLTKGKRIFTRAQVQKKMKLLNITRTDEHLQVILERNKKNGVFREGGLKAWATRKSQTF